MENPKPCKCGCGGEAYFWDDVNEHTGAIRIYCECKKCGIRTKPYESKEKAIKAWNLAMGRKIGEWIEWEAPNGIDRGIECSECGYKCSAYPGYGSAFCPTCGAKMKDYFEDVPMEYFESGGTLQNFADTSQITCPKCHSEFVILPESNNALTWEELQQMKGKPVFVVEEGYQTWEYWSLVYWMKDDELTLLNENGQMTYSKNEQGTVWQAYRKEKHE